MQYDRYFSDGARSLRYESFSRTPFVGIQRLDISRAESCRCSFSRHGDDRKADKRRIYPRSALSFPPMMNGGIQARGARIRVANRAFKLPNVEGGDWIADVDSRSAANLELYGFEAVYPFRREITRSQRICPVLEKQTSQGILAYPPRARNPFRRAPLTPTARTSKPSTWSSA